MQLELPETYNAATTFGDENIAQGRGGRIAIYYRDEKISYQEVFERVNRTGNALKELGDLDGAVQFYMKVNALFIAFG